MKVSNLQVSFQAIKEKATLGDLLILEAGVEKLIKENPNFDAEVTNEDLNKTTNFAEDLLEELNQEVKEWDLFI